MRGSRNRIALLVEAMESRLVMSALAPAPAPAIRGAGTAAVAIKEAVATPLEKGPDAVEILNSSGLEITVTATLAGHPAVRPIPKTFATGTNETFDFKKGSTAFIKITVTRSDLGTPPPFLKDFDLPKPRPVGGYDGAKFVVKVGQPGPYFNVSPLKPK